MSEATDRLAASVEHMTSVADSAATLIGNLAEEIRNNISDEAALNALADSLDSESDELAAAVTANTPAAPVPAEEPAPTSEAAAEGDEA